ncbi:hypothetical protein [Jannaschia formosa]|uniref:hypothetical protein n=1 Tax=Jannaschia formosa TaxID=2259592 RepID=UPI000E1BC9B6|nr:hypothetical protein [Jannaschia formosa]TFL19049.1 hypothetical protein DR046_06455 [Jannaschia formosa]
MTLQDRIGPARGLIQAALATGLVWALIPPEDGPALLRGAMIVLLAALAVAALATSTVAGPGKR